VNRSPTAPDLHIVQRAELPISNPLLIDLVGDVLSRGLPFRFCARGGSMFPFIRDGDVISVVPFGSHLPAIGDVVAFLHPSGDRLTVHRLTGKTKFKYLIQGDNHPPSQSDGWLPLSALLGRVSCIERKGRQLRLGLGPERYSIALCSRIGLLQILVRLAVTIYRWRI
jgi:hypothetical protein